jgi:hypothetical protein
MRGRGKTVVKVDRSRIIGGNRWGEHSEGDKQDQQDNAHHPQRLVSETTSEGHGWGNHRIISAAVGL